MTDYRIWPATNGPASATIDGGVVLATEFYVTAVNLFLKGLRFWRATTAIIGPITARVFTVVNGSSGTDLANSDATFTLVGTGWQEVLLTNLVPLTQSQRYRVAAQFPTNYSATSDYWSSGPGSADIVNGPLTAPNATHAIAGDQGSFIVSPTLAFPVNQFRSTSYWVDVIVTDTPPTPTVPDVTTLRTCVDGELGVRVGSGREPDQTVGGRVSTRQLTGGENAW